MKKLFAFISVWITIFMLPAQSVDCSEIIISEIYDGAHKAIELFNPTTNAIDLAPTYQLRVYFDGSLFPTIIQLTGTVPAESTYIVAEAGATTLGADQLDPMFIPDGDDAIVLTKSGIPVDIFGVIGEKPIDGWITGAGVTQGLSKGATLIRRGYIEGDKTDWHISQDWWYRFDSDTTDLGVHKSACLLPVVEFAYPFVNCGEAACSTWTTPVTITEEPSAQVFVPIDDVTFYACPAPILTLFEYVIWDDEAFFEVGHGGISQDWRIQIFDDADVEDDEHACVEFGPISGPAVAGGQWWHQVNVLNDDVMSRENEIVNSIKIMLLFSHPHQ